MAMSHLDHLLARGGGGKTHYLVITGVNLEQSCGAGGDGPLVIRGIGLVGRAHFPELCAALLHDLGDAKVAAHLD